MSAESPTLESMPTTISPPWAQRLAVFDLETTGVDTANDRVVTACVAILDENGTVRESRAWLADPGVPIPEAAARVHGVSTEQARAHGHPAAAVVADIRAALAAVFDAGVPLVAYNAAFDLTLLRAECLRHGIETLAEPSPVIDPMIIDKAVDRYRKGKRTLELVAEHYGVPLDTAHAADADAIAAGRLAIAIARKYPSELPDDVRALHEKQRTWAAEQAASFQEYLQRSGKLSQGEKIDGSWPVKA